MITIKRIMEKYSFIGSYGVLFLFIFWGFAPIILKDINVIVKGVGFISVFWLKYIVKNKFDLLKYDIDNRILPIIEMISLCLIFLIEPIIIFFSNPKGNVTLKDIAFLILASWVSFLFLFLFYNGYTTILKNRIKLLLIICLAIVITFIIGLCIIFKEYYLQLVILGFIYTAFYTLAFLGFFFVSKGNQIEIVLRENVYRCKITNGKIVSISRELFKGIFVPIPKYKNNLKILDFTIADKWKQLTSNLLDAKNDNDKQLIINCFFTNPVFCLEMSFKGSFMIFYIKVRCYLIVIAASILIILYRMSKGDLASSIIAFMILVNFVIKYYYSVYIRRSKYPHNCFVILFSVFMALFIYVCNIPLLYQFIILILSLGVFISNWVKSKILNQFVCKNENYVYFNIH